MRSAKIRLDPATGWRRATANTIVVEELTLNASHGHRLRHAVVALLLASVNVLGTA
jgi:hypothetical protein